MSQMLIGRGQQADPQASLARGHVPAGAGQFIHRAMQETGCSRSLALSALRLIVHRHRPQGSHLRGYLARFSTADLAHWIEQALSVERGAVAALLIGDFAEQVNIDRILGSDAERQAEADRRRAAFARVYPTSQPTPVTGMQRLDAAIKQLRRSSRRAAEAMDAVGAEPCDQACFHTNRKGRD